MSVVLNGNNKLKKGMPMILGIALIISIAVNGWLYTQLKPINQRIVDMNTELKSVKTEYNGLITKINNGKQSLADIQKKNSQLESNIIQTQTYASNTTKKTTQSKSSSSESKTNGSKSTGGSSGGSSSSGGSYTRQTGVPGTFPKTAADKNGDGIDDEFQNQESEEIRKDPGTTTSDNVGLDGGGN